MSKKFIKITGSVKDKKGYLSGIVEMETEEADRLIDLKVAREVEPPSFKTDDGKKTQKPDESKAGNELKESGDQGDDNPEEKAASKKKAAKSKIKTGPK